MSVSHTLPYVYKVGLEAEPTSRRGFKARKHAGKYSGKHISMVDHNYVERARAVVDGAGAGASVGDILWILYVGRAELTRKHNITRST